MAAVGTPSPSSEPLLLRQPPCAVTCNDAASQSLNGHPARSEFKRVLALAIPVTLSQILSFLAYLITTAQVGHIGSRELSAITLGRSIYHITGLSLIIGIASGVGTLGGQAFGAHQYELVGVVTQRAILINMLVCGLILAAWTQLNPLMLALGQNAELAGLASHYIVTISPSVILDAAAYCLQSYLTCQGVVTPLTMVAGVLALCTPVANHMFINVFGMGINGVACALVVVRAIGLGLLAAAVWVVGAGWHAPEVKTWCGWSRSSLTGWGQYLGVALPSLAMICASWWVFEAIILIAGRGPDAGIHLPVMGILFSTHSLVFMATGGFTAAACTRVSNLLGEGRGHMAQGAMTVCLVLTLCTDMVCAGGLVWGARPWAQLFSADERVLEGTVAAMPWMAASLLLDGVIDVLGGVLTGAGRQGLGFYAKLLCYWALGLPLAWYWGGLRGAVGLWQSMAAVTLLQTLILGGCVALFDWQAEAASAKRRVLVGVRSLSDFKDAGNYDQL